MLWRTAGVGAHNSVVGADQGFALHPGTRNRYEIRDTRPQHRPPSRQVNDHGRVSGTHTVGVCVLRGEAFGSQVRELGVEDVHAGPW